MMGILQGIMDEIPPFEKYRTHTFQNRSMPVVGEYQSKVFTFYRLRNEIFSPEEYTNKETSATIGDMVVTSAKVLLAKIRDEKSLRRSICKVLGADYVGIIHPMLTMWMLY